MACCHTPPLHCGMTPSPRPAVGSSCGPQDRELSKPSEYPSQGPTSRTKQQTSCYWSHLWNEWLQKRWWTHVYLQHTLMCGVFLQLNQPVQNNEFHVVVALFNDQINVALSSSLKQRTFNQCHSTIFHHAENIYMGTTLVLDTGTLMAVGALDRVTRVPAASYFTAGLDDCSRLYIQRMKRALSEGLAWQT